MHGFFTIKNICLCHFHLNLNQTSCLFTIKQRKQQVTTQFETFCHNECDWEAFEMRPTMVMVFIVPGWRWSFSFPIPTCTVLFLPNIYVLRYVYILGRPALANFHPQHPCEQKVPHTWPASHFSLFISVYTPRCNKVEL